MQFNPLLLCVLIAVATFFPGSTAPCDAAAPLNIAPAAKRATSYVSGHESLAAINDGYEPNDSSDHSHGAYGNWPEHGTQWLEYEWPVPISTNGIAAYWWQDNQGIYLPKAARLSYWDGGKFVPIDSPIGVEKNVYN